MFTFPVGFFSPTSQSLADQLNSLLFSESQYGGMWLPSVGDSVFTDLAGEVAASPDDNIRRINDLSGNGLHFVQSSDSRRPVWNGARLIANGTSHAMSVSTDFSGATDITIFAAIKKIGTSSAILIELFNNAPNTFSIIAPSSTTNNYFFRVRGDTSGAFSDTGSVFASPDDAFLVGRGGSSKENTLMRNGTVVARNDAGDVSGLVAGTLHLFARTGTSLFFSGELAALIVVEGFVSDEIAEEVSNILSSATMPFTLPNRGAKRFSDAMYSWWSKPLVAETGVDTYFGVTTTGGNIEVRGVSTGTAKTVVSGASKDDHIAPVLLSISGKMPLVFWHDRTNTKLFWQRGTTEGDFSTLGTTQEKDTTGSLRFNYTRAIYIEATEEIYVFGRLDADKWTYFKSEDDGVTFLDNVIFFDLEMTSAAQAYISFSEPTDGIVRCAIYTHPVSVAAIQAIYYCEVNFLNGEIRKADGTLIGNLATDLPLTLADLEKAYDAADDATVDTIRLYEVSSGSVKEIVYAAWDSSEAESTREYRYVYWTGSVWSQKTIALTGEKFGYASDIGYHGGITIPLDSSGHDFILSQESGGDWSIKRYTSIDSGDNFTSTVIRESLLTKLIRPTSLPGTYKLSIVDASSYGSNFSTWESDVLLLAIDT